MTIGNLNFIVNESLVRCPAWAWNPEDHAKHSPCVKPTIRDVIEGGRELYTLRGTQGEYIAKFSHLAKTDNFIRRLSACSLLVL